ncbi:MAG TPA: hypothetical protein VI893_04785 [Thermoplasmata archaeon]|nr:hypothetical protein [Thermoplasmata archaeon]
MKAGIKFIEQPRSEDAMTYTPVQPPFPLDLDLDLQGHSKQQLSEYAAWFAKSIPGRVAELARTVKETPGYEAWMPDITPRSLDKLGDWLAEQVKSRKMTKEASLTPGGLPDGDTVLTSRTLSLLMDAAMYLSKVVLAEVPAARMTQVFRDRRDMDYGHVVIAGPGPVPMNPFHLLMVLASKFADGSESGAGLRKLFEFWKAYAGLVGKR